MRGRLSLALLLTLAAGCGRDGSSEVRRIEGGTAVRWRGMSFDIPRGWTSTEKGDGLVLIPEGWSAANADELYLLGADPTIHSVDGPEADAAVERMVAQMGGSLAPQGPPAKRTFGAVEARVFRYEGTSNDGRSVVLRIYGFSSGSSVMALLALGTPARLSSREGELQAILASMSKAPAASAGGRHEELAGTWSYLSNVNATDGGRSTNSYVTLNGEGTYVWHWEVIDTNASGAAWNNEDDQGTWTATDDSLTLRSRNGQTSTMTLQKRNHPKNPGDPMIVLDGRSYVTATPRAPW